MDLITLSSSSRNVMHSFSKPWIWVSARGRRRVKWFWADISVQPALHGDLRITRHTVAQWPPGPVTA